MSALLPSPRGTGGYGALQVLVGQQLPLDVVACNGTSSEFLAPNASSGSGAVKRKRRPAGTPDPGAEVVALSPKTLMESDRYVCEICNQGFQRDQNLQMHRRRHKVPWKLLKRPSLGTNKRVYICPERSCLHHDPAHALGDLVGIKKHYRRKHCSEKQWQCDKCSKGYAVQSDYKAHLKTCGTRGHCCDCGRVFSRVESFIEHQDTCSAVKQKAMQSGGATGSDRVKTTTTSSSAPHHRNSLSPSQSSDTTQAMPFAHSGMSDTAAGDHTKVTDEHSRRIQESQAVPASSTPPMPAWLTTDYHSRRRRNELELLPSPTTPAHYSSSISLNPHPKSALREPSLQLSMGPYHPEVDPGIDVSEYNVDTKPSSSSIERVLVQKPVTIPTTDLAHLSVPDGKEFFEPGRSGDPENTDRLSGFLIRRLGPEDIQSNAGGTTFGHIQITSTRKQQQQQHHHLHSHGTESSIGAHYNPCAAATGSTSSYHEDLAANMHESDHAQGPWVMSRRGLNTKSQLEQVPVTSSDHAISSRSHALREIHKDVTEISNHHFAANSKSVEEGFRSQNHRNIMAAGSAGVETTGACDQVPIASWAELARVRRSKEEARQECEEAERDIARAEILKREAREQLQFAAAERAYADRARDVAKRQIEISEAELVRAKRLREHAQSELDKVGTSMSSPPPPAFCHSCKSALSNTPKLAATSSPPPLPPPPPPGSSTWSFMTPSTGLSDQTETDMSHLWSGDRSTLCRYRPSISSMAIAESPPTGLNSRVTTAGESTTSTALESDQDHHNITITPTKLDLDLN